MDIYRDFAHVYDDFIDAPYEDWADYIEEIWRAHGAAPKLVLDLACGTGNLTHVLAGRGYDMIGVDASAEMLSVAAQKGTGILFLHQDMRSFELYGTVDAIICMCDSLNYLKDPADLSRVFALAHNYLNPGGLFVFDINSRHKYQNMLADNIFAGTDENAAYIWENCYDPQSKINEYYITFFVKDGDGAFYRRFEEAHLQRAYGADEIKSALAGADLEYLAHYGELTFDAPKPDDARIFFVTRKGEYKN
ncbi:MAG: class I SAM-dependent methyltransferase [Clostridiales bacterium]|jgi:SAM-dependent methyltransferase|nr:class I SAM-dependent methyltransferase [Clostridiales bacterium]